MIIKMLKRAWQSGEARLLAYAVVLAVAVLSTISIFTDRLDSTLLRQSNSVMGGDLIIETPAPPSTSWEADADAFALNRASVALFSTMAFAGDAMQLVSVKAASSTYPLRGEIETSRVPFATDPVDIQAIKGVPERGEVWVDSRVLAQLGIAVGGKLGIGEAEFTVSRVITREPDATNMFSLMGGPRVLLNLDDLAQTQVVQPGSRVIYQRLFASDNAAQLRDFRQWVDDNKTEHQRIRDLKSSENRIARSLETGRQFLVIAAVMTVLLAGVAIAIAARRFAEQNVQAVALLKSLGCSIARVRRLYVGQLCWLALLASLVGLSVGWLIQTAIAWVIAEQFNIQLVSASVWPFGLSLVSGIVCLLAFALPVLWHLPSVAPLRILRRDIPVKSIKLGQQIAVAALAIMVLVAVFSRDMTLALSITAGLGVMVVLTFWLAWVGLNGVRRLAQAQGGVVRLAFANLHRRQGQSAVMILVFAVAFMLLLTLSILRTSLINDWQAQVPPDAPNHFLVNIPADEKVAISEWLDSNATNAEPLYPMVRGRLVKINGLVPNEELRRASGSFHRELNLTWSNEIGSDNRIEVGHWWPDAKKQTAHAGVSVEAEDAARIGLKLGDVLTFSLGGLEVETEIVSIRSLDWRSMRPNFFYIFEPGYWDAFSPTFITSFHLPRAEKSRLNDLLRHHPTIMVIELDRIIEQIQTIVRQVSWGVLLVFVLTLLGGCLVLLAAVISSIDSRRQEIGLLRAMGASRRLVQKSLLVEFAIIGAIAGALAMIGSESLVALVQLRVLEVPLQPHWEYWVAAPVLGALIIGTLGYIACRPLVVTPPAQVLRDAN